MKHLKNLVKSKYDELIDMLDITCKDDLEDIALKIKLKMFSRFDDYSNKENYYCKSISHGFATGILCSRTDIMSKKLENVNKILVTENGVFDDIQFLDKISGVIIMNGTPGCHAAIIARSKCVPAILIECEDEINLIRKHLKNNGECSIDGTIGLFCMKYVNAYTVEQKFVDRLKWWVSSGESLLKSYNLKMVSLYANADNIEEAEMARNLGAEGVGSSRIEHVFADERYINIMKGLILANEQDDLDYFCGKVAEIIRKNTYGILKVTVPHPFTIRLSDVLQSEFLVDDTQSYYDDLRGCRWGIVSRKVYECQIKGILEAVNDILNESKENVDIRIIIPFVSNIYEINYWSSNIHDKFTFLLKEYGARVALHIGSMIETPSSAMISSEIAEFCDVFTFGTNDLTQYTCAISRANMNKEYAKKCSVDRIFQDIDEKSVGRLIDVSIDSGRKTNSDLIIGICGEHINYVKSLQFFIKRNIDYFSCIPCNVLYLRILLLLLYLREML